MLGGTVIRRGIVATAIAASALMLAWESSASFLTGNDLLQFCQDISDSGYGRCLGYIEGVVDSMEAARLSHHMAACVREGVAPSKVHNVVIKYLRDHAETRNQAASGLVVNALSDAWHCVQTNP
jgi:hypothetical protein